MDYTDEKPNKPIATSQPLPTRAKTPDYLQGYRDGLKDGAKQRRRFSGDGILGALLAIALLTGLGYLGWNYLQTGSFLPFRVELEAPVKIITPNGEPAN